jgi:hypothetical protein
VRSNTNHEEMMSTTPVKAHHDLLIDDLNRTKKQLAELQNMVSISIHKIPTYVVVLCTWPAHLTSSPNLLRFQCRLLLITSLPAITIVSHVGRYPWESPIFFVFISCRVFFFFFSQIFHCQLKTGNAS